MCAVGDIDRFVDATVREGNSCGRDCVEGGWRSVSYNVRRAVSKQRGFERHLESSHVLGVKVYELVNDSVNSP
jgi:hypothetical protein